MSPCYHSNKYFSDLYCVQVWVYKVYFERKSSFGHYQWIVCPVADHLEAITNLNTLVTLSCAVLGDWQSSYRQCRKDEVDLCRACIGHSHLTHSYILKKDPPPQCEHCQCILTVRHILVECSHLARTRNYIFGRCGVVESFQFYPELVLNFFKDSAFYSKF